MELFSWYQHALENETLQFDEEQQNVIFALQRILDRWEDTKPTIATPWFWRKKSPIKRRGVYVYGGVGRGKTMLVDHFFDLVPSVKKGRWHFHVFMQHIHQALAQTQGQADPLKIIAMSWSENYELLVFDEFFVSDIADAMLLGRLFGFLFEFGTTIVFTSNIPPCDLYRNGLQRVRFLPAIAAIESHCDVVFLAGQKDHREVLQSRQSCFFTHQQKADFRQKALSFFSSESMAKTEWINGRSLPLKASSKSALWCDFEVLCVEPRHSTDYMILAQQYAYWLIETVPILTSDDDASARRFLALVDECYEKRVTLILLAQVPLRDLYQGNTLKFEFKRCLSRLEAMQSIDYAQS